MDGEVMAFVACTAVICAAVGIVLWYRRHTRRILENISSMLDEALRGEFRPERFDESLRSSVESKLRDCLAASALSARSLREEKARIESLVSDIAHQTRTPVANVLLYAQLLAERELDPEARGCVDALEQQAEKLRTLIDALVKTSRLETGMLALRPERNPLGPMLEAAVAQFLPAAESKRIQLTLVSTDAYARFDPKWTGEAVCNLLDNAVKYTPEGGHVRVEVTPYELFCRVDVADNGPGIPENEHAKVFSRFCRGAAHAGEEGVGLGLYLAREIVSSQGGYMKLSCPAEGGCVFSAFLPNLSAM